MSAVGDLPCPQVALLSAVGDLPPEVSLLVVDASRALPATDVLSSAAWCLGGAWPQGCPSPPAQGRPSAWPQACPSTPAQGRPLPPLILPSVPGEGPPPLPSPYGALRGLPAHPPARLATSPPAPPPTAAGHLTSLRLGPIRVGSVHSMAQVLGTLTNLRELKLHVSRLARVPARVTSRAPARVPARVPSRALPRGPPGLQGQPLGRPPQGMSCTSDRPPPCPPRWLAAGAPGALHQQPPTPLSAPLAAGGPAALRQRARRQPDPPPGGAGHTAAHALV
jgi:hypothetical protein